MEQQLINFLLFIFVGIMCVWAWDYIHKDKHTKEDPTNVGTLVLHVDGNEFVATSLELTKDILRAKTGDVVSMNVEVRQHSETNKGFNATDNS